MSKKLCQECLTYHRPGENTLCRTAQNKKDGEQAAGPHHWCPEHHVIAAVEDRAGRYRCPETGCTRTVQSIAAAALEMSSELSRIWRLPALDWARATADFTQHLAALARSGEQPAAMAAMKTLGKLKTYVNRVVRERDEANEAKDRLAKACECVSCHGSIMPPMQCGMCIEREKPVDGMPARPVTTSLREALDTTRQQLAETERRRWDAEDALTAERERLKRRTEQLEICRREVVRLTRLVNEGKAGGRDDQPKIHKNGCDAIIGGECRCPHSAKGQIGQ